MDYTEIIKVLMLPVILAGVWLVRLEGKVKLQEALQQEKSQNIEKLINTKFDAMDARLERIERAMNGHLTRV